MRSSREIRSQMREYRDGRDHFRASSVMVNYGRYCELIEVLRWVLEETEDAPT